jgi:hypothetical protein
MRTEQLAPSGSSVWWARHQHRPASSCVGEQRLNDDTANYLGKFST